MTGHTGVDCELGEMPSKRHFLRDARHGAFRKNPLSGNTLLPPFNPLREQAFQAVVWYAVKLHADSQVLEIILVWRVPNPSRANRETRLSDDLFIILGIEITEKHFGEWSQTSKSLASRTTTSPIP